MNSSNRKRDISKIQRQNVDPLWNIQNEQLKTDAEANSRLRQQITKQSYADSAVQADIKDKIELLKQKAVALAKNLQSEKRKNIELEAIIRHMAFIREQQKKVQATHRDDMNFESIDNLSKKIKKSEYDLQQMFAKLNDLTSKNKERKHEVDAYRTQRVIDSGIFLKIEKQIIQEETDYKKLLIQKTKYEQEYNKSLQNYKKMKNDIEKEQFISLSKRSSAQKPDQHQQFFVNLPQIEHAVKFTQLNYGQPKRKSFIGSKRNFSIIDQRKEQQKQQMQYAVKKVFMQTGLNSANTLIDCLENIDKINQQLFMKVNKDTDSICELSKQINDLNAKRKQKTIKYYESQPQMTKTEIKIKQAQNIEAQINKIDSQAKKISKSLQELQKTNELRQVGKMTNIQIFKQQGLDSLQSLFIQLEHKLNPMLINYAEFKKGLSLNESLSHRKQKQGQIKQESIEDLINKVRRVEQSQKIMVKEDFQREYEQIRRNEGNKNRSGKKRTTFVKKGH